jgi:integrase/recombinase XerD
MATTRAQDAMTREELDRFLQAVPSNSPTGQRNLALLTVLADTGLRLQEALDLSTGDLRREHGGRVVTHAAVIGKGGKPATVAVSTRAAARLYTWLEARAKLGIGSGLVFCTVSKGQATGLAAEGAELQPGEPLNPRYVRELVQRTAQRAGIERRVTPHTLRHTFATHLLQEGASLEQTAKALRHSRTATTSEVYAHLQPADVDELVRNLHAEPESTPDAETLALANALQALTAEQKAALRAVLGGD